jgi:hypothetical protein
LLRYDDPNEADPLRRLLNDPVKGQQLAVPIPSIGDGRYCRLCGWRFRWIDWEGAAYDGFGDEYGVAERILRSFKISSGQVALSELGMHLKNHFADIYSLAPYRFEELIGDVFREIGYSVEMTKQSRDGGVDLFILSAAGDRIGMVQCKRYAVDRTVSVSVVSELLGTQLAFDLGLAVLVTTSKFSRPARERAITEGVRRHGFQVSLVDATELLALLQVYNRQLPPLQCISESFLRSRGLVRTRAGGVRQE